MKRVRLVVSPDEASVTLQALLTGRGGLSVEVVAQALSVGGVSVNRRRVTTPDAPLRPRDEVIASLVEHGRKASGAPTLDASRLLLLDPQVIAVDKPSGLPAQGTASDATAGLDEAVRRLLTSRNEQAHVGLVHRLDLETTGVTVFGRTPKATTALATAFREGTVRKTYLCLVQGAPEWQRQEIDAPLGARDGRPGVYEVSASGRPSRTVFEVRERFEGAGFSAALLEASPATGRTHQIRVHAAHAGHPLLGDRRYGGPAFLSRANGQRIDLLRVALHALRLRAPHPSGGRLEVTAPLPEDLSALADRLRHWSRDG